MTLNRSQSNNAENNVPSNRDQAELWRQMSAMKSELERYKSEVDSLRKQLEISEDETATTVIKARPARTRRSMLKQMVAGAAGLGALSLTAAINSANNVALAGVDDETAIDAQPSAGGYALKATAGLAHVFLSPAGGSTAPTTGTHSKGELLANDSGLWYCAATGTPGTWVKIAGTGTAGSLNLLQYTDRFVNTRPGGANLGGVVGPLAAGSVTEFTLSPATGRQGLTIPSGATAILAGLTVADAGSAGLAKVFPASVTDSTLPSSTVNYNAGLTNTSFSCALTGGKLKVFVGSSCNVIIDVVGYFL